MIRIIIVVVTLATVSIAVWNSNIKLQSDSLPSEAKQEVTSSSLVNAHPRIEKDHNSNSPLAEETNKRESLIYTKTRRIQDKPATPLVDFDKLSVGNNRAGEELLHTKYNYDEYLSLIESNESLYELLESAKVMNRFNSSDIHYFSGYLQLVVEINDNYHTIKIALDTDDESNIRGCFSIHNSSETIIRSSKRNELVFIQTGLRHQIVIASENIALTVYSIWPPSKKGPNHIVHYFKSTSEGSVQIQGGGWSLPHLNLKKLTLDQFCANRNVLY